MEDFCGIYRLENLVKDPIYFKNPNKPSHIDLFLISCSRSFQDTQVVQTGLSDFHKMNISLLKVFYRKQKHDTIL